MGQTVKAQQPSTELNSRASRLTAALGGIDFNCAKASIDVNQAEIDADVTAMAFETFAAIGWTDKDAAGKMGMDTAQLSRIKKGEGHLSIKALWRLDADFWVPFRKCIDVAKGLSPENDEEVFAEQIGRLVTFCLKHRIARRRRELREVVNG